MENVPRGKEIKENEALREAIEKRARMYQTVRRFLDRRGFIEVETPCMVPRRSMLASAGTQYGVATETEQIAWLRTTPEHYLMQLIPAFDKLYEIGKDFRSDKPDDIHSPEFSVIEFYERRADWKSFMTMTEQLVEHVAREVIGTTTVQFRGHTVNLQAPWQRLTFRQAVHDKTGIDIEASPTQQTLYEAMVRAGIDIKQDKPRWMLLFKLSRYAEPHLIQPTFLTEYPSEWQWSSKVNDSNPCVRDQTEVFLAGGLEVANIYTMETRVDRLRHRTEIPGEMPGHSYDEAYLDDIALLGNDTVAENAIGLDRLLMVLTGQPIQNVIAFPWDRR